MHILILLSLLLFQQPAQQTSRPTEPSDPMPPPNMDYFLGAWTFEWNVPESPLGPAGKLKGKETYKKTKAGTYESAIEMLTKAISLDPEYAPAYYQLGLALRKKGRNAEARKAFDRARQLDPRLRIP